MLTLHPSVTLKMNINSVKYSHQQDLFLIDMFQFIDENHDYVIEEWLTYLRPWMFLHLKRVQE